MTPNPPQPGDLVILGISDVDRIRGRAQPVVKVGATHYEAPRPWFSVVHAPEHAWYFAQLFRPRRFLLEDEGATWSRPAAT